MYYISYRVIPDGHIVRKKSSKLFVNNSRIITVRWTIRDHYFSVQGRALLVERIPVFLYNSFFINNSF